MPHAGPPGVPAARVRRRASCSGWRSGRSSSATAGCRCDTTSNQVAAIALYRRHGWLETGRRRIGGLTVVYFEKELHPEADEHDLPAGTARTPERPGRRSAAADAATTGRVDPGAALRPSSPPVRARCAVARKASWSAASSTLRLTARAPWPTSVSLRSRIGRSHGGGVLQRRAHLPRVQRVDPRVGLEDGEQRRGVAHALPDVVVGRVGEQPARTARDRRRSRTRRSRSRRARTARSGSCRAAGPSRPPPRTARGAGSARRRPAGRRWSRRRCRAARAWSRPVAIRCSAAAWKSSKTFCLLPSMPGAVPLLALLAAAAQAGRWRRRRPPRPRPGSTAE